MNLDVFAAVRLACEIEVTAVKAGNVHPQASFADTTHIDFLRSAITLQVVWSEQADAPVGQWIYSAVKAVREQVGRNTNLGIILLLAPLAKAAMIASSLEGPLPSHDVLAHLDAHDAKWVYEAIRLANPGGLGKAPEHDVHAKPPACLISAMRLAAHYDDIAKQYVTNFADVYELAQRLTQLCNEGLDVFCAVERLQLERMATHVDTLIARKCGLEKAIAVQTHAQKVMDAGKIGSVTYKQAWFELDQYLRSDGNRLNPGTTADLLAAAIFVFLIQNPQHYEQTSLPR